MAAVPQRQEGPSVWQKLKYVKGYLNINKIDLPPRMGALMGGGVGLTIGFLFGSWSIIRSGFVFLVSTASPHCSLLTGVAQVHEVSSRPSLSTC
jgi:hypothetical protein